MSTFMGFTEEDLLRIKSGDSNTNNGDDTLYAVNTQNIKKISKIGVKSKRPQQIKINPQISDDAIDDINFEKCRLSLKSPQTPKESNNNEENSAISVSIDEDTDDINLSKISSCDDDDDKTSRKSSTQDAPDVVREIANNTADEPGAHKAKLEDLQLKQKLMEEQNRKRKEMLSKALADRTKQTEEEVMKLEKIKKELQVLDGQFSQDVAVLRKKIDQASLSYADSEKHYLKVEKEFLQAKLNLQKEREKKELLTEHLCALITHNETRKAKKLETLMLQLVDDKKTDDEGVDDDIEPEIVDGVDMRTGKMVELYS